MAVSPLDHLDPGRAAHEEEWERDRRSGPAPDEEEETMPNGTAFDLATVPEDWGKLRLKIGAVIEFELQKMRGEVEESCMAAVLIKAWSATEQDGGAWLEVKPLASTKEWGWEELVSAFSRKKMKIHLCRKQGEECPQSGE